MKLWKPKQGSHSIDILPIKIPEIYPTHYIADNYIADNYCHLCEFIAFKNRLHEFIESKKGFWTEPFIKFIK